MLRLRSPNNEWSPTARLTVGVGPTRSLPARGDAYQRPPRRGAAPTEAPLAGTAPARLRGAAPGQRHLPQEHLGWLQILEIGYDGCIVRHVDNVRQGGDQRRQHYTRCQRPPPPSLFLSTAATCSPQPLPLLPRLPHLCLQQQHQCPQPPFFLYSALLSPAFYRNHQSSLLHLIATSLSPASSSVVICSNHTVLRYRYHTASLPPAPPHPHHSQPMAKTFLPRPCPSPSSLLHYSRTFQPSAVTTDHTSAAPPSPSSSPSTSKTVAQRCPILLEQVTASTPRPANHRRTLVMLLPAVPSMLSSLFHRQ
ncbi:hypothetical protein B296_00007777 [Ensete ventricosum]|uniref:Uncharacterized protein n=1 Tax=Ensete ventricosum TaxID=4639 RepID=A0A427AIQ9_ENSVE|nr:hypothetical protein B296_00007777 [Ensete ventricosum]